MKSAPTTAEIQDGLDCSGEAGSVLRRLYTSGKLGLWTIS